MRPTMEDIARMAGVSIGTVSRVVNGKDKVRAETRARIQRLIDEVGYRPSAVAQGLARRMTNSIMLVVPNVSDDYYPSLVRHVSGLCREHRRRVLLGVSDSEPAVEADYLEQLGERTVDGLIISSLQSERNVGAFLRLAERGFPLVHLDMDCLNVKVNTVKYDDRLGARLAVGHLVERGHRRIALCAANAHFQTVQDRRKGYAERLQRAGVPVEDRLQVVSDTGLANWDREPFLELLRGDARPTAVLAENDVMAIACIRLICAEGLRVPEDVAVVGFDNTYPRYLVEKPLTTVALPVEQACREAVEMLLKLIGEGDSGRRSPRVRVLQPELVVGATT